MIADLSGAWLKFNRGREHAEALIREINARGESSADELRGQHNADSTMITFTLHRVIPIPQDRWATMLGDALFNYRCALDQLVYSLAVREAGSDPPPGDTALMFPITANTAALDRVGRRLKVMGPVVRAFVERAQPHDRADHPLLWLEDLHTVDEHRKLHIASISQAGPQSYMFIPNPRPDGSPSPETKVTFSMAAGPLEDGAPIAWAICGIPAPHMDVAVEITLQVAVSTATFTGGVAVFLDGIADSIDGILVEAQRLFV